MDVCRSVEAGDLWCLALCFPGGSLLRRVVGIANWWRCPVVSMVWLWEACAQLSIPKDFKLAHVPVVGIETFWCRVGVFRFLDSRPIFA